MTNNLARRLRKAAKAGAQGRGPAVVRSYVLAPQQRVTDHRTGVGTSDALAVLDGEIDPFLRARLALGAAGLPRAAS